MNFRPVILNKFSHRFLIPNNGFLILIPLKSWFEGSHSIARLSSTTGTEGGSWPPEIRAFARLQYAKL